MPIDLTALIDHHAQLPKHRQLAASLREAIDDGRLQPGEELPSETEMIAGTRTSRDTIRKGLALLEGEALIVRRHGAATKIAEAPPQRAMNASRYADELRILKAGGEHPLRSAFTEDHGITWAEYTCETHVTKEPATVEDARRLLITPGQDLLRRRFLKFAKGQPVEMQRSAIPWDLAGGSALADPGQQPWPGGTIAELFSLGLEVTRVQHDVSARAPRDEERKALRMETPGPVWDIVRVCWVGDRPVEASRVIAPGARYVLHYEVELDLTDG
jgi:GntR family transcriptional regulator